MAFQVELLEPSNDNWPSPGSPDTGEDACCPGATPDLAHQVRGVRRLILCGSWELPSMEFWRTDEIAPVVLIILFELMALGLINCTAPAS